MLEEKTQDLMINMRGLLPLIVSNALNVLGAILILLIGLWLAGKADQLVVRTLSRAPALRRDAEELLRQPRALPRPVGYRARGAVGVRHPDVEPDCRARCRRPC